MRLTRRRLMGWLGAAAGALCVAWRGKANRPREGRRVAWSVYDARCGLRAPFTMRIQGIMGEGGRVIDLPPDMGVIKAGEVISLDLGQDKGEFITAYCTELLPLDTRRRGA